MHKGVKKKNEFINDALFFFFSARNYCFLFFSLNQSVAIFYLFPCLILFLFTLFCFALKKKKKPSVFVYSWKHKLKVIQKYKTLNYRLHFYPTLLSSGLIPILNSPFLLFKIILFLFLFHKNPFLFMTLFKIQKMNNASDDTNGNQILLTLHASF